MTVDKTTVHKHFVDVMTVSRMSIDKMSVYQMTTEKMKYYCHSGQRFSMCFFSKKDFIISLLQNFFYGSKEPHHNKLECLSLSFAFTLVQHLPRKLQPILA